MARMKKSEKNGINRCPNCGGSDVRLDIKSGKLKCNSCRTLFDDVFCLFKTAVFYSIGVEVHTEGTVISKLKSKCFSAVIFYSYMHENRSLICSARIVNCAVIIFYGHRGI